MYLLFTHISSCTSRAASAVGGGGGSGGADMSMEPTTVLKRKRLGDNSGGDEEDSEGSGGSGQGEQGEASKAKAKAKSRKGDNDKQASSGWATRTSSARFGARARAAKKHPNLFRPPHLRHQHLASALARLTNPGAPRERERGPGFPGPPEATFFEPFFAGSDACG